MLLCTDFGIFDVTVKTARYRHGDNLCVQLVTNSGEPFATITVNIPSEHRLAENEAFVDTNNCPWAEVFLKTHGIAKPVGKTAKSGFCTYPLYAFNLETE